MPSKRIWIPMLSVLVLLSLVFIIAAFMNNPDIPEALPFKYENQPSMGDASSPVKIVEFGDFKCPPCKQFADSVIPQIKKDYIDKGIVQLYFMNDSIIENSALAAVAGESIYHQDAAAFWKYYDAVYKSQQDEKQDWATADFLINLVKTNKILTSVYQLTTDLQNLNYLKDVEEDTKAAYDAKVTGTPAFFINGKLFTGNDYTSLQQAIVNAMK